MKRYLLFLYDIYYPHGGMNDFNGFFDTIEEAEKQLKVEDYEPEYQKYHIFDTVTGDTIRPITT